ncbi:Pycsar system effector family protein [Rhodanobacter sp. FW102-FHT14D06]|uniref:Pycsar system effector family protein n=2 Tax=unclassified Rhodanobacter TaxID=2621553 RepID=A0AB74UYN3_9GAMM
MNKQGDDGLGKDINDYLNHYVLVADGKAATLAAGSLVLVGLALSSEVNNAEPILWLIGTILAGLSAVLAGAVLYPRTPHLGNGHIFWADIRSFDSAESYWKSLRQLDGDAVGREYARQNYFVSQVLLRKNTMVQRTIWVLALACLCLSIAFGVR